MIQLVQFPPAWGLPNASPFCFKVENLLRIYGLPYEVVSESDIRKTPKGKLPYILDGATLIADSSFIADHLEIVAGRSLDDHLSVTEQATLLAFRRLFEESFYFALLYFRWIVPENFQKTRAAFFGDFAFPLSAIVPFIALRATRKTLLGQGMGRHSADEVFQIGKRDLKAAADFLADKTYFMGKKLSSLDATAFAFLANLLWQPISSPMVDYSREFKNLEAYCQRMKQELYPESVPPK